MSITRKSPGSSVAISVDGARGLSLYLCGALGPSSKASGLTEMGLVLAASRTDGPAEAQDGRRESTELELALVFGARGSPAAQGLDEGRLSSRAVLACLRDPANVHKFSEPNR